MVKMNFGGLVCSKVVSGRCSRIKIEYGESTKVQVRARWVKAATNLRNVN